MADPQEILNTFLNDLYCQRLGKYPDPESMLAEDRGVKVKNTRAARIPGMERPELGVRNS